MKNDNVDLTTVKIKYPLCSIHPDAQIAEDVVIDPFVTIQKDVTIDEGCWIGSNVVIHSGARIGKNCRIFPGAVISSIPQDLKFEGEYSTTEIGENTTLREYVTVNRGTSHRGKTLVGKNVLVMAYTHIAHDCIIGDEVILSNAVNMAGHVVIEDFAIIGGMTAIHQFARIGKHSFISGGSLARKDVPPFTKSGREPLTFAGVNSVGMKRKGFKQEAIHQVQEMYRAIYSSGMNNSTALEYIEKTFPQIPERDEIVNFIRASERGIIRGSSK